MRKFRSIFAMIMVLLLSVSSVMCVSAAENIKLVIDGTTVQSSVAPAVSNGTTLVPLRIATENLGASVVWNKTTQEATIKTSAYTVVFKIGSTSYTVNGSKKSLPTAPKLVNGSTMVPIRALAEAIGAKVNYSSATNTATIDYFTTMTGSIKITGSTTVQPIAQAAADKLMKMNTGLSISVAGGGSGAGVKDTTAGTNNLGMSSRELTADESATVYSLPVANDGIAIIINPSNPVKNLTKEQASKIFLGEIKNWKEVGGNDAPIFVQTRETGSGTRATLEEMLLAKKSVVATATPFTSSALIKQAVAKEVNGIGYDSIGFVDSTVKVVSINSVMPTAETVKSASYTMGRSLFMLSKGAPTGVSAMFVDYMKSLDCQNNIVKKEGYITILK